MIGPSVYLVRVRLRWCFAVQAVRPQFWLAVSALKVRVASEKDFDAEFKSWILEAYAVGEQKRLAR